MLVYQRVSLLYLSCQALSLFMFPRVLKWFSFPSGDVLWIPTAIVQIPNTHWHPMGILALFTNMNAMVEIFTITVPMNPHTFIHYMDRYCVYIIHLLFFIPKPIHVIFHITSIKNHQKLWPGMFSAVWPSTTPDLVTISHAARPPKSCKKSCGRTAGPKLPVRCLRSTEDSRFVGTLGRGFRGRMG